MVDVEAGGSDVRLGAECGEIGRAAQVACDRVAEAMLDAERVVGDAFGLVLQRTLQGFPSRLRDEAVQLQDIVRVDLVEPLRGSVNLR